MDLLYGILALAYVLLVCAEVCAVARLNDELNGRHRMDEPPARAPRPVFPAPRKAR